MRALRIHSFGLENLRVEEVPDPVPGAGELLIRLSAASLNYRDLLMVGGQYNPKQPLPLIPCSDGAGVVEAVGTDVLGWKVGDRAAPCFAPHWQSGPPERSAIRRTLGGPLPGTLAEKITVPATGAVKIPAQYPETEAATFPCAGVTAWSALVTMGKIRAGQSVLVQGTGGVSLFALQIARMHGARVIATSSQAEKLNRLQELGVRDVINYRENPAWGKAARQLTGGAGVDHVVEVGGGNTLAQSLAAVRPGGQIHMIGVLGGASAKLDLLPILMNNVRVQGVLVGHRESFSQLIIAASENKLRPVVDKVFELEDAKRAFQRLQSGQHFGKIVVNLR